MKENKREEEEFMMADLFEEIEQLAIAAIPTTGTTIAA